MVRMLLHCCRGPDHWLGGGPGENSPKHRTTTAATQHDLTDPAPPVPAEQPRSDASSGVRSVSGVIHMLDVHGCFDCTRCVRDGSVMAQARVHPLAPVRPGWSSRACACPTSDLIPPCMLSRTALPLSRCRACCMALEPS